jgi:hypothetical protein
MKPSKHWTFPARFRTNAYGWRGTALASQRLKEAVTEIKKVAKSDPVTAAEGCIVLMERLWPALQSIDSSSGALGRAVNHTLGALISILASAKCDRKLREKWLERLYQAVCDDGVQYLTPVEEQWGAICGYPELANEWADRILPLLRAVWAERRPGGHICGDTLCLSCLLETGRYNELEEVLSLRGMLFWPNDKFLAEALARDGRIDEAIAYAESHHDEHYERPAITAFCERILFDAGRREDAYRRYGLFASQATTNLGVFRTTAARYPEKDHRQVLLNLIEARGNKGKWFAAAKEAGFLDIALQCASTGEAEPATMVRAARDFLDRDTEFALQVALCATRDLLGGRGYEPSTADIRQSCDHLIAAATRLGRLHWAKTELERLFSDPEWCLIPEMRNEVQARLRYHTVS